MWWLALAVDTDTARAISELVAPCVTVRSIAARVRPSSADNDASAGRN